MDKTRLCIIAPCYNEKEVLPETIRQLTSFIQKNSDLLSDDSKILFVDDGSADETWQIILNAAKNDTHVSGISLSRNRGHQNALWAGMEAAKDRYDCIISIDADLQDDVNAMRDFLIKYRGGADVVYGVRSSRESDNPFKRLTAEGYYKLMRLLGAETVFNHADFRLLSNRALSALTEYGEVNLYLRGMVPLIGFNSEKVYYERKRRQAGKSKYPLKKMLALAMQGATSFSVKPLSFIWALGLIVTVLTLIIGLILWIVPQRQLGFTVFSIWFSLGLILSALGMTGEYIGKIYAETKRRPRYFIKGKTEEDEKP